MARIRKEQNAKKLTKDKLFFYFDPPFFEKADDLYRYYFTPEDHTKLRDALLVLTDKWILS